MAGLESLIKLHKHELDEKRQALAKLYDIQDGLLKEKQNIEHKFEEEKKAVGQNQDMAFIFSDYCEAVKNKLEVNAAKQQDIRVQIEIAKDSMMETFSELKKYEKTHEMREKRKKDARDKKEVKELDEIAIEGFRRKAEEKNKETA